jgi:EAL domain-containing protein (putative c-di-GMP-specific phosphodiesterase class I)
LRGRLRPSGRCRICGMEPRTIRIGLLIRGPVVNDDIGSSPSPVALGASPRPLLAAVVAGGMERVLGLARKHLGMDGAFVAEFTDGKQVYRALDGDAAGFGFALGDGPPLEQTYCRLMTAGEIPNAVADARGHATVGALAITREAGIGSYVGVPIRLADGTLYGSLCCLSHDSAPVDDRDAKFLFLLADLVAGEAEADRSRAELRARIAELIDTDRIRVALQPIVNITTGRMVGFEALARFKAGPPNLVFEQAHTVGLREQLELLALHHCWQVLPLLPRECYLAVNLSPDVAVAGFTAPDQLDRLEIGLDRVVLEITEHAAVASYETLRQGLADARTRGLRLAIDDAGAGFASLHHIAELRPDLIKIDRSWRRESRNRPTSRSRAICASTPRRGTCSRARAPTARTCAHGSRGGSPFHGHMPIRSCPPHRGGLRRRDRSGFRPVRA